MAEEKSRFEKALKSFGAEIAEAADLARAQRREDVPDPARTIRRAALPTTRLWQRRRGHEDFLALHRARRRAWKPRSRAACRPARGEVKEVVKSATCAPRRGGRAVQGRRRRHRRRSRRARWRVARSLVCQAAVHRGPADLTIGVFVDEGREPDWEWAKWLPHTRSARRRRWAVAVGAAQRSEALLRRSARDDRHRTALLVLDSDLLIEGRNAPRASCSAAAAQAGALDAPRPRLSVAGIVLAAHRERLPASCTVDRERAGRTQPARPPTRATDGQELIVAGLDPATARPCARDLARFEDPELSAGAGLPGQRAAAAAARARRRQRRRRSARWGRPPAGSAGPVGVTEQGVFTLDLERDGPHGLVGGTTGSGKSELLRSLIAALAANADPRQLTFLLMDFKGGAAFDACARLPHTVGMVTDLDEAARRAGAARAGGRAPVPRAAAAQRRRRQPARLPRARATTSRCRASWS